MNRYLLIANLIFVVHWLYIGCVVGGFVCILIGYFRGWQWTRNLWLRSIHLLMMGFVVFEVGMDWECVLTTWERDYRVRGGDETFQGDFIHEWAVRLFDMDFPLWLWNLGYYTFGGLVLLVFVMHPPRRPRWRTRIPLAYSEVPAPVE